MGLNMFTSYIEPVGISIFRKLKHPSIGGLSGGFGMSRYTKYNTSNGFSIKAFTKRKVLLPFVISSISLAGEVYIIRSMDDETIEHIKKGVFSQILL